MKKFKFKLQSVLDARSKVLENCQLAMAKVLHRLKQEQEHLDYLYTTVNITKCDLENLLSSGNFIDLLSINNHQGYIFKLKNDIINQHKIIADTEVELDAKKNEVLEALKAKTMLEKLKEKAQKEFKFNFEKLDLAEIDEIATNRFKKVNFY